MAHFRVGFWSKLYKISLAPYGNSTTLYKISLQEVFSRISYVFFSFCGKLIGLCISYKWANQQPGSAIQNGAHCTIWREKHPPATTALPPSSYSQTDRSLHLRLIHTPPPPPPPEAKRSSAQAAGDAVAERGLRALDDCTIPCQ